jgi:heptosyltransferase II
MKKVNVVVQTAFIGDLFLSIPLLLRLKKNYPDHETILVCKKGLKEIFLKWNIVEHVFEVEKGRADSYNAIAQQINEFDVQTVFCLHQSLRSALFTMKLKSQTKIGFGGIFKKFFFNHVVNYVKAWPDVIRQISILAPVDPEMSQIIRSKDWTYLNRKTPDGGFETIPQVFQFPSLGLGLDRAASSQKQIALFPGSVWATKKWTHEGFGELAKKLTQQGFRVCVMGGPDDMTDSLMIQKIAPQVEILTGKMSLYESSMYISEFDLIICNDSAPAHIAASLQRPVLSIFGPTVLDFGFRPWNDKSQVIEEQLSCRPCGPHGHQKCPLVHHNCMKKIKSDSVYKKALEMLRS